MLVTSWCPFPLMTGNGLNCFKLAQPLKVQCHFILAEGLPLNFSTNLSSVNHAISFNPDPC